MNLNEKINSQFDALMKSSAMDAALRQMAITEELRQAQQSLEQQSELREQQTLRTTMQLAQEREAQARLAQERFEQREQNGMTGFTGVVNSIPSNLVKALAGGTILASLFVGARKIMDSNTALTENNILVAGLETISKTEPSQVPNFLNEIKGSLTEDKQASFLNHLSTNPQAIQMLTQSPSLLIELAKTFPSAFVDKTEEAKFDPSNLKLNMLTASTTPDALSEYLSFQAARFKKLDAALESLGMPIGERDDLITTVMEKGSALDTERIARAAISLSQSGLPIDLSKLGNELKNMLGESKLSNFVSGFVPMQEKGQQIDLASELSRAVVSLDSVASPTDELEINRTLTPASTPRPRM
jgi:hypothetical protein